MTEKVFVDLLEKVLREEGYLSEREVGVGYGIADLVIIKKSSFDSENCDKRKGYKQKSRLLNEEYFRILSHLPDFDEKENSVCVDYLVEKTGLSKSHLKYTLLKDLQRKRFIKVTKDGTYFKINGWAPLANEVIAIEAKLKDWKRGFIQANRYKSFADRTYLAIPKETAHLVDRKLLKKHNIGLIVLDAEKRLKTIPIRTKKRAPSNAHMKNFAIEHFWRSRNLKQLA